MWKKVSGKLMNVSCGSSNQVWGVSKSHSIYRRKGDKWERIPGALIQVSVGEDGEVWGISKDHSIYRLDGKEWKKIGGNLARISVGSADEVWGFTKDGTIFKYTGKGASPWEKRGTIPIINPFDENIPDASSVSNSLRGDISASSDGTVWVTNKDGDVYRLENGSWIIKPGQLHRISVGSEKDIFGVNNYFSIFKYFDNGDEDDPWMKIPEVGLKNISVGSDGSVWGTNKSDEIYHYLPDVAWEQEFQSITYQEINPPETKQDLIMERKIENVSKSASVEQTITYSRSRTATYEWGLSRNLHTGFKVSFETNVPFGSMSGELSVDLDLGSHETWTKSEKQELSVVDSVSVPAGERVVLRSFYDWADNVETPFILQLKISGKSKDITLPEVYEANSLDEVELSGEQIRRVILLISPEAEISHVFPNAVELSLPGTFSGSYAINTSTQLESLE